MMSPPGLFWVPQVRINISPPFFSFSGLQKHKAYCSLSVCAAILQKKKLLRQPTFMVSFEEQKTYFLSPNVGLEPTTLRLRVSCSTD